MVDGPEQLLSPEQAVDRLEALHNAAVVALRTALARFAASGTPPDAATRAGFRYPELRLDWHPTGAIPFTRRAWAKFQVPGGYATTVTQPEFFRRYLLQQLRPLVHEYGATIAVRRSAQEMPYPYVLEGRDELMQGAIPPRAVFFSNDVLAFGALLQCQRRGWPVPQQVAIAGFTDTELASEFNPSLTTVQAGLRLRFLPKRD